jgi:hypothetical protein
MTQYETTAVDMAEIQPWHPPIESVRKALLERSVVSATAPGTQTALPIEALNTLGHYAALDGLLFDLGHLPNSAIKSESLRATGLYRNGHIDHPYQMPYVIFHTWENGPVAYLVIPNNSTPHCFIAVELLPARLRGAKVLLVGDSATIEYPPGTAMDPLKSFPYPSPLRELSGLPDPHGDPVRSALQNCTEPVVATMLLLVTENVAIEKVPASKLLKAYRTGKDRRPLPSHFQVDTAPYITALQSKGHRSVAAGLGGTHASPVPHLRRGHLRALPTGATTWVRDCLVMVADRDDRFSRSHYQLPRPTPSPRPK